MSSRATPDPKLVVKDTLRGIRAIVVQGSKAIAQQAQPHLATPFDDGAAEFMENAEKISRKADRLVQNLLGLDVDEAALGPLQSVHGGTQDEARDASNLYTALALTAKTFGLKGVLISEVVCAQIVVDADTTAPDETDRAVAFFDRLNGSHVLQVSPPAMGEDVKAQNDLLTLIKFTVTLWAFLDREDFDDTELELLQYCCEFAELKRDDVLASNKHGDATRDIFQFGLESL